ncbi:hypothetical protein D3C80_1228910 [compost metagenome]
MVTIACTSRHRDIDSSIIDSINFLWVNEVVIAFHKRILNVEPVSQAVSKQLGSNRVRDFARALPYLTPILRHKGSMWVLPTMLPTVIRSVVHPFTWIFYFHHYATQKNSDV